MEQQLKYLLSTKNMRYFLYRTDLVYSNNRLYLCKRFNIKVWEKTEITFAQKAEINVPLKLAVKVLKTPHIHNSKCIENHIFIYYIFMAILY